LTILDRYNNEKEFCFTRNRKIGVIMLAFTKKQTSSFRI